LKIACVLSDWGKEEPCSNEYRGLTHPYKIGLYCEEYLLFINSSREPYLSDVGLNPIEYWPLTHPHASTRPNGPEVWTMQEAQRWTR